MITDGLDLTNSDLLGDEFSYADGCGTPPIGSPTKIITGTRRECKKILGREVCVNVPTVKTVPNEEYLNRLKKYKDCISDKAKDLGKGIKTGAGKFGKGIKKTVKKLKDKIGVGGKRFRNRFRAILRKGILRNIGNNIHGTATRLYPAFASSADIKNRKYKPSFVAKSKNIYAQLLAKWKKLGGNEADLKSAIIQGSKKRFLKSPYKSFNGNNSIEFYDYWTPDNFYCGADGEESSLDEGVYSESEMIEEVPDQQEQTKGMMGFFAWLMSLFKRGDANEIPYEEGVDATAFNSDALSDINNIPNESEINNEVMRELDSSANSDDAGGATDADAGAESDDTILGIPKTAFWIGVGVLALVGGFLIYRGIKGNK